MESNYKFSKHLSTRMKTSGKTGLKTQRGQEKRRSPEEEDEGILCGWKVNEDHGLWDDIGIEDCVEEVYLSEESISNPPGRRCPLLMALEAELQDEEAFTRENEEANSLPDLPALIQPTSPQDPQELSSIKQTGKSREKRAMQEQWSRKSKQAVSAKTPYDKPTSYESQFQEATGEVGDLAENKECCDTAVVNSSRKCKQEGTQRKSSCKKTAESRSSLPRPPPVAAIIYTDKKLKSNLRSRMKRRTDTKTCLKKDESEQKEKKSVNPSLIGCPAEMNEPLELASACSESKSDGEKENILRKASDLKLPHIGGGLEGPKRKERTKIRTACCNSQQLSVCECEDCKSDIARRGFRASDPKCNDLSDINQKYKDMKGGSRKSTPQKTAVKNGSFQFDVLEQYSVLRKTSTESIGKSSPDQASCHNESFDVTQRTRVPGCSNKVKLPPFSSADCTRDVQSFDAVRALWCVLQRERLVVHVSRNARRLSKGSRSLASELMLRNRTPSAKVQESIFDEEEAFFKGFRASKSQCPLQRIRDVTNKRLELQEDSGDIFHAERLGRNIKCKNAGALEPLESVGFLPYDCMYSTWRDPDTNDVSREKHQVSSQVSWPHS